jgi:hypothetical protein
MKSEATDTPPKMVEQEPTGDDEQLPFPTLQSGNNVPRVTPVRLRPKESSTSSLQSLSSKRKRSTDSNQNDAELLRTPSKSAKRGPATTPKEPQDTSTV